MVENRSWTWRQQADVNSCSSGKKLPSFMDSWSCYNPQFTKPVSLTQLTLPSVPRGYYIHLCSKSTTALKSQLQATSYRTFGTGG